MKYLIFGLLLCSTIASFAQDGKSENKALSKHEVGLNFRVAEGGGVFFPNLNYRYYLKENRILNFGAYGELGSIRNAVHLEFWDERRHIVGAKKKWFFSHGLGLRADYIRDDRRFQNPAEGLRESLSLGLGYHFGMGYKLNRRLSINANVKPILNYSLADQFNFGKKWNYSAPWSLGINYRL